ncbi:vancomycin resistance protein [Paenibacillus albidus]|uniref:Vancomycin resistance protein n=1 Tax=Paenibacillus albidus TaxID=2041023 RepID=A0A917FLE1_9BACL|nr:VanW family protein [Paenibacillus albidus]GGF87947.1 vancomycin resistance protein [Paenibacillus albidus]
MKKIHAALIVVISLILAGSLVAGGLHLYAGQPTLPEGTRLAGWEVGGMDYGEVRSGLEQRLVALESLRLTLTAKGASQLTLTLKEAGLRYSADSFVQGLSRLTEGSLLDRVNARRNFPRSWEIEGRMDWKPLKQQLSPDWEKKAFGTPVDATRRITEDDRVLYSPGTTAYAVDWNALETALQAALPTGFSRLETLAGQGLALEIPLVVLQPDVTLQALKEQGVERKITQFSTSLGASGPGRTYNVEAAAKAVDGTILPPEGIFDYGKAIEKAKTDYGFREAPVIVSGKLQPGIGGGICQVSSTLYNAALRSGLEIVERRNHSLPVSYLPKGQDATFAEGYINFRFRNTTGKYLMIKAAVQGRSLTIKLFGTFPRNVSYTVESKTVKVLPPEDKIIRDASMAPGSSRILQNGKTGYVIDTYLIRLVDGKPVEKTKLSRDTYLAQKRLVAANQAASRRSPVPEATERPLLEDGVRP